jgi:hypothetical protein
MTHVKHHDVPKKANSMRGIAARQLGTGANAAKREAQGRGLESR